MIFLLDTCIISELRRPKPDENLMAWYMNQDEDMFFLCSVSIGEVEYGISRLHEGNKKTELIKWLDQVLSIFQHSILSIDQQTALLWGQLRAQQESSGRTLPMADGLIAATALHSKATLVTRNTKDFDGIDNLQLLNPFID